MYPVFNKAKKIENTFSICSVPFLLRPLATYVTPSQLILLLLTSTNFSDVFALKTSSRARLPSNPKPFQAILMLIMDVFFWRPLHRPTAPDNRMWFQLRSRNCRLELAPIKDRDYHWFFFLIHNIHFCKCSGAHRIIILSHYENIPIQIYWNFYHQQMKIFR